MLQEIVVFTIVGCGMMASMLALSWILQPLGHRKESAQAIECGFPAKGDARAMGFNYIQYAMLFLVFDLATIYLFLFTVADLPLSASIGFAAGLATLCIIIIHGTDRRRYYVA